MGRCKTEGKKQITNQYAEEKKWDFSFDLKEVSEEELLHICLWLVDWFMQVYVCVLEKKEEDPNQAVSTQLKIWVS